MNRDRFLPISLASRHVRQFVPSRACCQIHTAEAGGCRSVEADGCTVSRPHFWPSHPAASSAPSAFMPNSHAVKEQFRHGDPASRYSAMASTRLWGRKCAEIVTGKAAAQPCGRGMQKCSYSSGTGLPLPGCPGTLRCYLPPGAQKGSEPAVKVNQFHASFLLSAMPLSAASNSSLSCRNGRSSGVRRNPFISSSSFGSARLVPAAFSSGRSHTQTAEPPPGNRTCVPKQFPPALRARRRSPG